MARFVDSRVTFDRAVSREPLAVAADAARMDFECCFGTFVPSVAGAGIVFGQEPAWHEKILLLLPLRDNSRSAHVPQRARMQGRTLAYA